MIVDTVSLKTEALLLFCRDLIHTYNDETKVSSDSIFITDSYLDKFIAQHIENLTKGINAILQPNDYYIRNSKVTRIRIILNLYNSINGYKTFAKRSEI